MSWNAPNRLTLRLECAPIIIVSVFHDKYNASVTEEIVHSKNCPLFYYFPAGYHTKIGNTVPLRLELDQILSAQIHGIPTWLRKWHVTGSLKQNDRKRLLLVNLSIRHFAWYITHQTKETCRHISISFMHGFIFEEISHHEQYASSKVFLAIILRKEE